MMDLCFFTLESLIKAHGIQQGQFFFSILFLNSFGVFPIFTLKLFSTFLFVCGRNRHKRIPDLIA